jgi:4-methyl-5(b-hydroxyethyl)-thiazole monophosphate biosynthesis
MPTVLVPLANGFEEIEALTIIDILRRANVEVVTASLEALTVTGAHRVSVLADTTLDTVMADEFDMLVLPGGLPGADYLNADTRIHQLITRLAQAHKTVAAICAAPKVLIDNGVVAGKQITAYPGALAQTNTNAVAVTGTAVQVDGRIITGRGPGTAMDFALQLVETLQGNAIRQTVEAQLVRL